MKSFLTILLAFSITITWAQKPNKHERLLAKKVGKHIKYLASDELQGRGMTTEGETKAAVYIAKQFAKIGLTSATDSSYFQPIPIVNLRMTQNSTTLAIDGDTAKLYSDYYPLAESINNTQYIGEAVNVAYGIVDEGLERDDYANKNVAGKAVLINLDLPNGTNDHNRYISYEGRKLRARLALSKGAKIVIFYTNNAELTPDGDLLNTTAVKTAPTLFIKKDLDKPSYQIALRLNILSMATSTQNVIGLIDNKKKYTVIVGAHYDGLGAGKSIYSNKPGSTDIHKGADDNASGVAALIELAGQVKSNPKAFKEYNYMFIAFTGNKKGLIGSESFLLSDLFVSRPFNYMINLDMIGRLDSTKILTIKGTGTASTWLQNIEGVKRKSSKIAAIKTSATAVSTTDNSLFFNVAVPALHITTGYHADFNTPADIAEKINLDGEAYIINYTCGLMADLDKKEKLQFREPEGMHPRTFHWQIHAGIIPDYNYSGKGIRVADVLENSAFYEAGILEKDTIIAIDNNTIDSVEKYLVILAQLEKGTKTSILIQRGGKTETLAIHFR